ncbi:hypothetical protein DL766_001482 [Monosporascus sp. MC13-8B]|uniref:Dynamin-type G domain-containing protein n=1 Tax=Monosporascus cannonballus TaxID=155416 RepID=A0ABY0HHV4_9PEZI|nr:hypothetical protein DL762_002448 [Monosporascus cannonballus]RYO99765.1 hypothetical protein DL763_001264 [Monosporascus cannonballus]RYP37602.1 hypothetical protein DL766_001482 [Monosporascus sp. MC13-8B]
MSALSASPPAHGPRTSLHKYVTGYRIHLSERGRAVSKQAKLQARARVVSLSQKAFDREILAAWRGEPESRMIPIHAIISPPSLQVKRDRLVRLEISPETDHHCGWAACISADGDTPKTARTEDSDVHSNDAQLGYHASGNTQNDAIEIPEDTDSDIESSDDNDESDTALGTCAEAGGTCASELDSGERNWASRPPASPDRTVPSSVDKASPEPWCSPAFPSSPSAVGRCASDPNVNQLAEIATGARSPMTGFEFCTTYKDAQQPTSSDDSPQNEELMPEPSDIGDQGLMQSSPAMDGVDQTLDGATEYSHPTVSTREGGVTPGIVNHSPVSQSSESIPSDPNEPTPSPKIVPGTVTQAEVRSDSSRSSPRRFGRTIAASHSEYDSFSDSSSEGSCGSDDDYAPEHVGGTQVGNNKGASTHGPTSKRRRNSRAENRKAHRYREDEEHRVWPQTNTGGRRGHEFGACGITSPPLSHISSEDGPLLEGLSASFTEWPLHDASLKRVMLDGKATFQLQFIWDLNAESGHRHQPAKYQQAKRAASTRQAIPLLTNPGRLKKIDQLRERNTGAYLPLPQLVAVGDQNSGKSSLLESLSGIPFPRGQELCTRYATQITHRREAHQRIDINIIPGQNASHEHKKKLDLYRKHVNAFINIRTIINSVGENTFFKDVLKIEKCGPNENYLTIIDVPGIFRTTTEGITTNKDKELVKDMVKKYIKDSRIIILAVLFSNVDVATQEILTLTEEVDPAGDRTLGILTKADLLPLKLGYHVVTNRGGDDYGEEDDALAGLRKREAMFLEHPWSNLPEDRIGISALRKRLEVLLGEIMDHRKQQQYLVSIASSFQALVRAALNADYSAHPAFARNELRLITAVVNITDQFNIKFGNFARTYSFESEAKKAAVAPIVATAVPCEKEEDVGGQLSVFDVPAPTTFPNLDRIIVTDWAIEVPRRGIMKWIDAVHHRSRGLDLGSLGPGILPNTILLVHRFILTALEVVCADAQVLQNVSSVILGNLCAKYEGSMAQATLPVNVERQLKPYTLNHYFNHNQQRGYGLRIKETLKPKARREHPGDSWKPLVTNLSDVEQAVTNKSNAAHAKERIHDDLEAYYRVAYKRFVDNVFSQAVDYKLLSGPESPLRLFSEQ